MNRATAYQIHTELTDKDIQAGIASVGRNEYMIEIYGPGLDPEALAHVLRPVNAQDLPFEITDEGWLRLG